MLKNQSVSFKNLTLTFVGCVLAIGIAGCASSGKKGFDSNFGWRDGELMRIAVGRVFNEQIRNSVNGNNVPLLSNASRDIFGMSAVRALDFPGQTNYWNNYGDNNTNGFVTAVREVKAGKKTCWEFNAVVRTGEYQGEVDGIACKKGEGNPWLIKRP